MKIKNSLRNAKNRHKDCRLVRRKGRVFVINKTNPRLQGAPAEPRGSMLAIPRCLARRQRRIHGRCQPAGHHAWAKPIGWGAAAR